MKKIMSSININKLINLLKICNPDFLFELITVTSYTNK
jgi:hypothetical protein